MAARRFLIDTALAKQSFYQIPLLSEFAAIIPILFIIGIGYRPLLIITLIILGIATASRGITSNQQPLLADHVSVVLFLSLVSLTWVLVLELNTVGQVLTVGVLTMILLYLLRRGITQLLRQRSVLSKQSASASDIVHSSLLAAIAVTALGWSSLFYYSLALAFVILVRHWVKNRAQNTLCLLLLTIGATASWSVRQQNEGQFWISFDQLFRSSIAEGLPKWGRNDFVAATGTTFSYHWLGEVTAGVIARLTGLSAVDGVIKVLPALAIVFILSALVQLGKRLGFDRKEVMIASLFTVILCHEFSIYSIGTIWGFALFVIGLDILEQIRREVPSDSGTRLVMMALVLGITVLLLLTQTTLGFYFFVFSAIIFGIVMFQGKYFKPCLVSVIILQFLAICILRLTLLAGAEESGWQPSISIRNILQFRGLDLYYGDQWMFIAITSVLLLFTISQMMSGLGLISFNQLKAHTSFLLIGVITLCSLLLVNLISIGGPAAQQTRFLSPLVVLGTFISLLFFVGEVVNHPFQTTVGIRLTALASAAAVIVGSLLYLKGAIYDGEFSRQKRLGAGLFVISIQILFFALLFIRWKTVSKLAIHFFVTLLLGGLILVGHSRVLSKITNVLPRTIDRQREEVFTGTTETQECLKFVRDATPTDSIVASNWIRIPHPSRQEKYFLVTARTERRAYVDGPLYVVEPRPLWLENRVKTSDEFAELASEIAFKSLQIANVSFFIVNKEEDTATSWEPYATPVFERSSCLVLQLRQPVE